VDFGYVVVNTTSGVKSFTLSNNMTTPLAISSIAVSKGSVFAVDPSTTCGGTLAAKSACTIGVTLAPTAVGSASDTLVITTGANNSPLNVALIGKGYKGN
jgi:hypothetical protein